MSVRNLCGALLKCVAALLAATFFLAGCAGLGQKGRGREEAVYSAEAAGLYAALCETNKTLVTFKGAGTISVTQGDRKQHFRAVWAAEAPDRLRIQLLGPTGQPVASLACDGSDYYFLSHMEGKLIKRRADASVFKKFINIPIDAEDVFVLLSGRPKPPNEKLVAGIEKEMETVLVIRDTEDRISDRVYPDPQGAFIRQIERVGEGGQLIWRALLDDRKNENGYSIPRRITLSSGEDDRVRIETERFWANPEVTKDMFVIQSP